MTLCALINYVKIVKIKQFKKKGRVEILHLLVYFTINCASQWSQGKVRSIFQFSHVIGLVHFPGAGLGGIASGPAVWWLYGMPAS